MPWCVLAEADRRIDLTSFGNLIIDRIVNHPWFVSLIFTCKSINKDFTVRLKEKWERWKSWGCEYDDDGTHIFIFCWIITFTYMYDFFFLFFFLNQDTAKEEEINHSDLVKPRISIPLGHVWYAAGSDMINF